MLILASLACVMFIGAEVALLVQADLDGLDPTHQLPLFVAILAAAAAAVLAYLEGPLAAARARVLALTDPLTGLRNRRAFEEYLTVAYEQVKPFGVVYVDLDGFKAVNDSHGHAAGDRVLQHAAEMGGLSGSFGIATREDASSAAKLLSAADQAMYRAKRAGGGRVGMAASSSR